MGATNNPPSRLNLSLDSADFSDLFSSYHDEGLGKALKDRVADAFERSLRAQFSDKLINLRLDLASIPDTTIRSILETGEFQIRIHQFCLDLRKNSVDRITEAILPSGTKSGYRTWDGSLVDTPVTIEFRDMATRDRYVIRTASFFLPSQLFGFREDEVAACQCESEKLRPYRHRAHSSDYMIWLCACCGAQYFCECSRGVPEHYASRPGYVVADAQALLESGTYREGICHLCRDLPSSVVYISRMYGSQIQTNYYPYMKQFAVQKNVDMREAENLVRDRLGVPRIGEGWIAETQLYNTVRMLYPHYEVVREASPVWLGRQRFDIYIPKAGVAIEYQGEQHYMAVGLFGGEEGMKRAQERDRDKQSKAEEAGILIVEFRYDEQLDEEAIKERIDAAIKAQTST